MEKEKIDLLLIKMFELKLRHYTDITIRVWREELEKMSDTQIMNGLNFIISDKCPAYWEITVFKNAAKGKIDYKKEAENAYDYVMRLASAGGGKIEDETIQRALSSVGGMYNFRQGLVKKEDFTRAYIGMAEDKKENTGGLIELI